MLHVGSEGTELKKGLKVTPSSISERDQYFKATSLIFAYVFFESVSSFVSLTQHGVTQCSKMCGDVKAFHHNL